MSMKPNFNELLKQAQKMQKDLQDKQEALSKKTITGTSGAGLVEIIRYGNGSIQSIKLEAEATPGMSEEDRDILSALIIAAFNDSQQKIDAESQASLGSGLGGFELPAGLNNLFK